MIVSGQISNNKAEYSFPKNTWTFFATNKAEQVVYGNGIWCALIEDTGIYYSEDGENWTLCLSIDDTDFYSILYAGGKWFAKYYYSSDGKNWILNTSSNKKQLEEVYFYSNYYIGISSTSAYIYSLNGVDWSTVSTSTTGSIEHIEIGDQGIIFFAEKGIFFTENPINSSFTKLTENPLPSSSTWLGITKGNDKILVSSKLLLYVSTNDLAFSTYTPPSTSSGYDYITYGKNLYVMGTSSATQPIYYSEDLSSWKKTNISGKLDSLCFINGLFLATFQFSRILAFSEDGKQWTTITIPLNSNISSNTADITCGKRKLVIRIQGTICTTTL